MIDIIPNKFLHHWMAKLPPRKKFSMLKKEDVFIFNGVFYMKISENTAEPLVKDDKNKNSRKFDSEKRVRYLEIKKNGEKNVS